MPDATTPGGAVSVPRRRSVTVRRWVRRGDEAAALVGGLRGGERAEDPSRAGPFVERAVGGHGDLGPVAAVGRAAVRRGGDGDAQALAGVDVRARARGLEHVGGIALL